MAWQKPTRIALRTLAKREDILAILIVAVSALSVVSIATAGTGNGAPSGPHFNLNIIGVKNTANYPCADNSGGNVISVPLNGKANIFLALAPSGQSFYVLDNNAVCDGDASFQLPNPLLTTITTTFTSGGTTTTAITGNPAYTVWARVEGIPGGKGSMTTCATDVSTGELVCSLNSLLLFSHKQLDQKGGKQVFTNVTNDLTQLCFVQTTTSGTTTITLTGQVTCVPIFDSSFQNFFWSYDNNGNKVLQLRFYPTQA